MAPMLVLIHLGVLLSVAAAVVNVKDSYSYSYEVGDDKTGDFKSHHESRSGGVVRGSYSLLEPGGTWRIVEYTADPIRGFRAIVHRRAPGLEAALNMTTTTPRVKEALSTTTHAPNNLGDFAAVMFSTTRRKKKLSTRRQFDSYNKTT